METKIGERAERKQMREESKNLPSFFSSAEECHRRGPRGRGLERVHGCERVKEQRDCGYKIIERI